MRYLVGAPLATVLLLAGAGCENFLEVRNPDTLEADNLDPVTDGPVFAASAFQNFAVAYGTAIVYSAWWSQEARVGDTFPTRNEFGRRFIDVTNGTLEDVWTDIARAASTADQVVELLADARDVPLARAALAAGFSLILMSETFCQGAIRGGPAMSPLEMQDLAVERLVLARDVAAGLSGAEAEQIGPAANVGIARAHLQAGRTAEAAQAAAAVPDGFEFVVNYEDDVGNRDRLGNSVWNFTVDRQSLVVAPMYRDWSDEGDPRITYEDAGHAAQDGELQMYRQLKYEGWSAPIRLASSLEARYIEVEAAGTLAEQLAFINERRAAGGQPADFSSNDSDVVLGELMTQRSRDFWLEGKRMGDYRRHPGSVIGVLESGSDYYKPGVGDVGDQTCWPVPDDEFLNNPNFPRS